MPQRIPKAWRYWHVNVDYIDKFGWYQVAAGVLMLLQPHKGIAWFIESQVPFLHPQMFAVMMVIGGIALIAIGGRVPLMEQYQYKRWSLLIWFVYIGMSFIAAIRPYPANPTTIPGVVQIPGVVVVIYVFTADILVSQLMRLRRDASTSTIKPV